VYISSRKPPVTADGNRSSGRPVGAAPYPLGGSAVDERTVGLLGLVYVDRFAARLRGMVSGELCLVGLDALDRAKQWAGLTSLAQPTADPRFPGTLPGDRHHHTHQPRRRACQRRGRKVPVVLLCSVVTRWLRPG
jgi:hypothetical protein